MEITAYRTGELRPGLLKALCARVYAAHPAYAEALAAELEHQLAPGNPFLKRGSRENFAVMKNGELLAHACAITDPRLPAGAGLVGYFEAAAAGAARLALWAACSALSGKGAKTAYGPVNDTIWHRYGAVIEASLPPYHGEPFTPPEYGAWFRETGFKPVDTRLSATIPSGLEPFEAYGESRAALEARGFVFSELGAADLPRRAGDIHALAGAVFGGSPLFVPAGLDEFLYSAGAKAGGSRLVLASDSAGRPAAFLWGLPDALSEGRNFIFKTIAVLPEHQGRGLGKALFSVMSSAARAEHYIFSTMRSGNSGIKALASRGSAPYREYLTFGREL